MAGEAYQIPTGSDILSYKGNPGLAAGAGTQLSSIEGNPLAGIDSSLDKIQSTNQQKAIMDYQQKLKQREDLRKMLAETGGSVFNMQGPNGQKMGFSPLPDDSKVLMDKAHDMRKMILDHPDNYMFNQDYLDAKQNYDQLVSHAGVRSVAYNQYNQEAQKATDPDERTDIMNHRDLEIGGHKLSEGYMPEPWMSRLAINEGNLIKPEDLANKANWNSSQTTSTDDQGNQLYNTKETLNPSVADFRANVVPGTPAYNTASQIAKGYINVIAQNPALVESHNKTIDQINIDHGYKPGDPHFVSHVADVQTDPATGQKRVIINTTDPATIAYASMMEKHGQARKKSEINEDAGDLESDEQDSRKTEAQIRKDNAEAKKAEFELKTGKSATAEELKEDRNKTEVASIANEVRGVYKDAFSKPTLTANYPSYYKKNGINPDEYKIYPEVPMGVADKYIGIPAPETDIKTKNAATGQEMTTKATGGSIKPDRIVPIENKKTGEKELAYWKDGAVKAIVPEKQAMVNKIKHENNYDEKLYGQQTPYVDEAYNNTGKTGNVKSAPAPKTSTSHPGYEKRITPSGTAYFVGPDNNPYKEDESGNLVLVKKKT